jgi:hypothetical protein
LLPANDIGSRGAASLVDHLKDNTRLEELHASFLTTEALKDVEHPMLKIFNTKTGMDEDVASDLARKLVLEEAALSKGRASAASRADSGTSAFIEDAGPHGGVSTSR